jgi:hypothetical protein
VKLPSIRVKIYITCIPIEFFSRFINDPLKYVCFSNSSGERCVRSSVCHLNSASHKGESFLAYGRRRIDMNTIPKGRMGKLGVAFCAVFNLPRRFYE